MTERRLLELSFAPARRTRAVPADLWGRREAQAEPRRGAGEWTAAALVALALVLALLA
jgi:hypothetical protein